MFTIKTLVELLQKWIIVVVDHKTQTVKGAGSRVQRIPVALRYLRSVRFKTHPLKHFVAHFVEFRTNHGSRITNPESRITPDPMNSPHAKLAKAAKACSPRPVFLRVLRAL